VASAQRFTARLAEVLATADAGQVTPRGSSGDTTE
jgi:hypothetical protein